MPSLVPPILAVLSTIAGAGASGTMLVLLLASSPNSSPQQFASIRNWMIAIAVVALLGIVGAIWALVVKRPWHAAGIGLAPALFTLASFVILWRSQP